MTFHLTNFLILGKKKQFFQDGNYDLDNTFTRIDAEALNILLHRYGYDRQMTGYLVNGFRNGFSLQFTGNRAGRNEARNLRLRIGSEEILWEKIMKEVKEK